MTVTVENWTYERYRELPDDGNRYEVLGGRLHATPAPSSYHQTVSRRIQFLFYQLERNGEGCIFDAPIDSLLPGATPAQPDLVYVTSDRQDIITKRGIEGIPDLVTEILSPSTATRDRVDKLNIYKRAGIRRYLIADMMARALEVLRLDGDSYRLEASLGPGDVHVLEEYPVTLDVDEIFAGIPVE